MIEGDRWNADARIRRTLSEDEPHVERVYEVTPALAEQADALYAKRRIDAHGATA